MNDAYLIETLFSSQWKRTKSLLWTIEAANKKAEQLARLRAIRKTRVLHVSINPNPISYFPPQDLEYSMFRAWLFPTSDYPPEPPYEFFVPTPAPLLIYTEILPGPIVTEIDPQNVNENTTVFKLARVTPTRQALYVEEPTDSAAEPT